MQRSVGSIVVSLFPCSRKGTSSVRIWLFNSTHKLLVCVPQWKVPGERRNSDPTCRSEQGMKWSVQEGKQRPEWDGMHVRNGIHGLPGSNLAKRWSQGRRAEREGPMGSSDHPFLNPTWYRNPLLKIPDQWLANLCLEFSKIFLADTELLHSDPSPGKDLATQLQGMWLAEHLQLLVPSGSASAFELRLVFSGSPQPMAEQGSSTKGLTISAQHGTPLMGNLCFGAPCWSGRD